MHDVMPLPMEGTLRAYCVTMDPKMVDRMIGRMTWGDAALLKSDLTLLGIGMHWHVSLNNGIWGEISAAEKALRSIDCVNLVNLPGSGVVGFGAFPFRPREPTGLNVYELTLGRSRKGIAWCTGIGATCSEDVEEMLRSAFSTRPRSEDCASPKLADVRVMEGPPLSKYEEQVRAIIGMIEVGKLRKVVLARELNLDLPYLDGLSRMVYRLWERNRPCTVYAIPSGAELFIGASPELLLSRRGRRVWSRPLAGTRVVSKGVAPETPLVQSEKDCNEHGIVVEQVVKDLSPFCQELRLEGPSVIQLKGLEHLGTGIAGVLKESNTTNGRWPGALEVLRSLHPTAAVCGDPREVAMETILQLETFSRGPYAGAVGWMDRDGDGDWVLGIRGSIINKADRSVRIIAGAGIVAASVPASEVREVEAKAAAIVGSMFD